MPDVSRSRPNVILIVSDDHGYADRSALGVRDDVRTPALDRLAAEGVSCADAYVSAPICSPSRAGIISSVHQARWGALWFDSSSFPPKEIPTLAERFAEDGYATGYFGKVHYGRDRPGDRACPENHGFDESFYGLAGTQMGRLNYLHHTRKAVDQYGPEAARAMAVHPLRDAGNDVEFDGFLTSELGGRACDFVARHAEQPFFLMIAFNAVHNFCWQLPDDELTRRSLPRLPDWTPALGDYDDWYDDAISPNLEHGREYYLAQLELMDAEIGRLLTLLDDTGLAADTLVAYTTDNGGSTCNYGDNSPLRGTKYSLWDGGVRVPFIVRWPSGLPGGAIRSGLASALDLGPTALSAAGVASDGADLDGVDLGPFLRGAEPSPHPALHWSTGWSWAVRAGDDKLSWVDPDSREAAGIRVQQHADIGSGYFLAHLATDPGETDNLLGREPDRARALWRLHRDWCAEVGGGELAEVSAEPGSVGPLQ